MIHFVVPGNPVGKGRPRVTRYATYTPEKTKDYERRILEAWYAQSRKKCCGKSIKCTVKFWFPIPKSMSKKRAALLNGTPHLKKPDLDNCIKCVLDACNGKVYDDDSAVYCIDAEKRYSDRPRTEVYFEEVV